MNTFRVDIELLELSTCNTQIIYIVVVPRLRSSRYRLSDGNEITKEIPRSSLYLYPSGDLNILCAPFLKYWLNDGEILSTYSYFHPFIHLDDPQCTCGSGQKVAVRGNRSLCPPHSLTRPISPETQNNPTCGSCFELPHPELQIVPVVLCGFIMVVK